MSELNASLSSLSRPPRKRSTEVPRLDAAMGAAEPAPAPARSGCMGGFGGGAYGDELTDFMASAGAAPAPGAAGFGGGGGGFSGGGGYGGGYGGGFSAAASLVADSGFDDPSWFSQCLQPAKAPRVTQPPRGATLRLSLLSTWGDPNYVGLSALELSDDKGEPLTIDDPKVTVRASPQGVCELPGLTDDPRTVREREGGRSTPSFPPAPPPACALSFTAMRPLNHSHAPSHSQTPPPCFRHSEPLTCTFSPPASSTGGQALRRRGGHHRPPLDVARALHTRGAPRGRHRDARRPWPLAPPPVELQRLAHALQPRRAPRGAPPRRHAPMGRRAAAGAGLRHGRRAPRDRHRAQRRARHPPQASRPRRADGCLCQGEEPHAAPRGGRRDANLPRHRHAAAWHRERPHALPRRPSRLARLRRRPLAGAARRRARATLEGGTAQLGAIAGVGDDGRAARVHNPLHMGRRQLLWARGLGAAWREGRARAGDGAHARRLAARSERAPTRQPRPSHRRQARRRHQRDDRLEPHVARPVAAGDGPRPHVAHRPAARRPRRRAARVELQQVRGGRGARHPAPPRAPRRRARLGARRRRAAQGARPRPLRSRAARAAPFKGHA